MNNEFSSERHSRLLLRPSNRKPVMLLAVSAVLVLGGLRVAANGNPAGWILTGIFLVSAAVWGLEALPQAHSLLLDPEGLCIKNHFLTSRFRWPDIGEFGVLEHEAIGFISGKTTVYMTIRMPSFSGPGPARRFPLPSHYGLPAGRLAEVLRKWHERFGGGSR